MAKNLDGIKKLGPEEIKKYREMVLNLIGEKSETDLGGQKKPNQENVAVKKIDGLKTNSLYRNEKTLNVAAEEKLKKQAEEARLKEAIKRQAEARLKVKEEEDNYLAEKERAEKEIRLKELEKIRQAEDKIKQEKIAKAINLKQHQEQLAAEEKKRKQALKQEELKKKLVKEQAERLEREKLQAEKNRLEQELKQKLAIRREVAEHRRQELKMVKRLAKEKRKLKHHQARLKLRRNLKVIFDKFYLTIKKNFSYIVAFTVLFFVGAYLILCLAVLRFNITNGSVIKLAESLRVPAVLTDYGIISYHDFLNLKNNLPTGLNIKEKALARWLVVNNIKHNLNSPANATDAEVAIKFIQDKKNNQTALLRINKIDELLKSGASLENLSKYADEFHGGVNLNLVEAKAKFGQTALELKSGQVSEIIYGDDGYYLIEKIGESNGQIVLNYLFIKAKTLADYLSAVVPQTKVFILAN